MKIKKNGKIVNLTETDLRRIVKRTLNEQDSVAPSSLPSCKKVMGDLAKEDLDKKNSKTGKDGKKKIGALGIAREKVTLHTSSGGPNSGVLVAYKGGKAWCKC